MDTEIEAEDLLPELTEEERDKALADIRRSEPWKSLYRGARPTARRRIVIAYLISKYRGKRNMWPVREERVKIENKMTAADFQYLARSWYSEVGKEHFRDLCHRARARARRTDKSFARLAAGLPEADREIVNQTMTAVGDLEDPVTVTRDLVWDALCGSVEAQALLGDCFLHEHEVLRDVDIAAFWLRKAAPDNKTAKRQLSGLEAEGLV